MALKHQVDNIMTHFNATLIASQKPISIVHIERLEGMIADFKIGLNGKPSWLAPHMAARIPLQNMPSFEQVKAFRSALDSEKIDILFTPANKSKPKLFLADMDSTIVTSETLDELADKAGIKKQIAAITTRAMNGELDFHSALKERVALIKGLPLSSLKETLDETVLCDGAKNLVEHLREQNVICVLVSGGFTYFTSDIAKQCGFHHHHGNILNHDGYVLDGTVATPILDKNSKLEFLKSYASDLNISIEETMAIGDGANDLPMLCAAGLGIGYRPKPIVEETVPNILKYADLHKLVYVMLDYQ